MESLLARCSGKRKRRESDSGKGKRRESEEETSSDPSLDLLGDDLLIEILHRLPTAKSALGFKLVSKRWCSLIPTPRFITKFITHHVNINKHNPFDVMKQFTVHTGVFVCAKYPHPLKQPFFIALDKQVPASNLFTFKFLPVVGKFVCVLASCNDLLLCRAETKDCVHFDYFICNPFTKQWLLLPPTDPTVKHFDLVRVKHFGFVYEPNYEAWVRGINDCRFRIVCFLESFEDSSQWYICCYCSETIQWNNRVPLDQVPNFRSNIFAFNGKLYWYSSRDVVVAYDPFSNETVIIDGYVTKGFDVSIVNEISVSLGICRGNLSFMKLVKECQSGEVVYLLTVWKLCIDTGRMNLMHRIVLPETAGFLSEVETLAFHLNREDLVYLVDPFHIITYEIASGKLEKLPPKIPFRVSEDVFTVLLPWWPTLVPMLPQN